mgnify:CR=1 FL=1
MGKSTVIPFGPQHPVLPEPVHLDLELQDEKVVRAIPSIGYVHRGLEKLVEKRDFQQYVYIAERVCGICSFGHGWGYSQCVEGLMNIEEDMLKEAYKKRIYQILDMDLPFEKCGLAHFTTPLVCKIDPVGVFDAFSDEEYEEIFTRVAEYGMGVELNTNVKYLDADEEEFRHHLRPYRIAKKAGCKFYLGGDAHTPDKFHTCLLMFRRVVDTLELTEDDKFPFVKKITDEINERDL